MPAPASNGAISIPSVHSAERLKSVTKAIASVVRISGNSVRRRVFSVGGLWGSSGANCRNRRSMAKRIAIQPNRRLFAFVPIKWDCQIRVIEA